MIGRISIGCPFRHSNFDSNGEPIENETQNICKHITENGVGYCARWLMQGVPCDYAHNDSVKKSICKLGSDCNKIPPGTKAWLKKKRLNRCDVSSSRKKASIGSRKKPTGPSGKWVSGRNKLHQAWISSRASSSRNKNWNKDKKEMERTKAKNKGKEEDDSGSRSSSPTMMELPAGAKIMMIDGKAHIVMPMA
jgi:hypothetical protein